MAHKGRIHPYHWYYWATECQFFPGYVSWQMVIDHVTAYGPPWYAAVGLVGQLSTPGTYVPDKTQMTWTYGGALLPGHYYLFFSLEQEEISGVVYAVWKCDLFAYLIPVGSCYYFKPAPQFEFGLTFGRWWSLHDPASARDGPAIEIRPAKWNEITSQPHS